MIWAWETLQTILTKAAKKLKSWSSPLHPHLQLETKHFQNCSEGSCLRSQVSRWTHRNQLLWLSLVTLLFPVKMEEYCVNQYEYWSGWSSGHEKCPNPRYWASTLRGLRLHVSNRDTDWKPWVNSGPLLPNCSSSRLFPAKKSNFKIDPEIISDLSNFSRHETERLKCSKNYRTWLKQPTTMSWTQQKRSI